MCIRDSTHTHTPSQRETAIPSACHREHRTGGIGGAANYLSSASAVLSRYRTLHSTPVAHAPIHPTTLRNPNLHPRDLAPLDP
eukprot:3509728-Rhodomonas_salina.1